MGVEPPGLFDEMTVQEVWAAYTSAVVLAADRRFWPAGRVSAEACVQFWALNFSVFWFSFAAGTCCRAFAAVSCVFGRFFPSLAVRVFDCEARVFFWLRYLSMSWFFAGFGLVFREPGVYLGFMIFGVQACGFCGSFVVFSLFLSASCCYFFHPLDDE